MTVTISDRKGVVSVHAGLASYEKLRDYPIIKTTEPYHKATHAFGNRSTSLHLMFWRSPRGRQKALPLMSSNVLLVAL